jgi:sugar lactone lactonase YvrE
MKNLSIASSFLVAFFLSVGPFDLSANPGDLYSGQVANKEIDKFTPAGTRTVFVSGFVADALAFDSKGNLFVADTSRGKIVKVTPGGAAGDFATIGNPMGLAFDAAGNLFVATTGSIIKLTPNGTSSTFKAGLNGPFGLAFDRSGNLFVSETNTTNMGRIVKLTPTATQTTFASGLSSPEGLAFDSAGNLYEADFSSGKIFKFTPGGVKSTFTSGLLGPRNIAIDQSDNVYVATFSTQEILKFTPAGTPVGGFPFASNVNAGGLAFEPATGQLTNISTRASVQTGQGVTIAGFIVTGTDSKTVVLRGLGPTLGQPPFNLAGVLADPTLQLFDGSGHPLWFNDNWKDTQQTQIQNLGSVCAGSPCQPANDLESAILQILPPGNYTAILSGKSGTTGIGLVEVYDISPGVFSELTNVSTRGFVGTGNSVMIGGFITSGGNGSTEVVVRGLGPTLAAPPFNLAGTLADPVVTLVDHNGMVVQTNDNWKNTQQAAIQATGLAPSNDVESAMVVTVATGSYTAILSGKNGGTGIGLVEVYNVK